MTNQDDYEINCQLRSVVPEAGIKDWGKSVHSLYTVGCNYMSLPLISISEDKCGLACDILSIVDTSFNETYGVISFCTFDAP